MSPDSVELTHEETHCEYCGAPLVSRESAIWDDGHRWAYCSTRCVERDRHFRFSTPLAPRPEPSLDGLAGLMIGVKRDGDVAVVLMERPDGGQFAIGFERVTYVLCLPAPNARVTAVRRRDYTVIFDFEPTCPAHLEIRAARTTLATLS